MKKFSTILLVILFFITLGVAEKGLYVEQKVYTSGVMGQPAKNSTSKTWLSDTGYRMESDDQIVIFRFDTKKIWGINPQKKEYTEMGADEMKEMAQMGKAMMKETGGFKFTFKKTGKTKKINNWNCYEVFAESGGMKQSMWLTEDLPYGKETYYKFYKNMPEVQEMAESVFNSKELKGYPVATETEMSMMGIEIKSTSEVTLIKEQEMPSKIFDLPNGLKKMESPMEMMRKGNFNR